MLPFLLHQIEKYRVWNKACCLWAKKYYGIEILHGKPLITGVDEQPNPEFSAIVQIFVEIVTMTPACVCYKRLSSQHIFFDHNNWHRH